MQTIAEAFKHAASRWAERTAIEGDAADLNYRQLDCWSDEIAEELCLRGIRDGDLVPMLMDRGSAFVAGVLGVLKAGAAYVPLDPAWPATRIAYIIDQTRASLCLVSADDRLAETLRCPVHLIGSFKDSVPPKTAASSAQSCNANAESPAYVMYTSGSTGEPKGSLIPHRAVLRLVLNADFAGMSEHERWGLISSVAFDASTLELWAPLLNGGTCVIFRGQPSIDAVADFLVDRKVTACWLTAGLFNLLVDYRIESMAGVTQLLTGGDTESKHHMARFVRAHPQNRLIHGYGPTENTTFTLCHTIQPEDVASTRRIAIGRPINGTVVRIVDPTGADCPDGETGELLAGGQGLALGYLNRPELTAERFVEIQGERWYRTGDLVRRRDGGAIEFVGRVDRQVKIQGHRIEPEEIEQAMMSHPNVTTAAVEVEGTSADEKRLIAYFSTPTASGMSVDSLRAWLAERLPRYAIPAQMVHLSEMPLSTTGKVDRERLRALLTQCDQENGAGLAGARESGGTTRSKLAAIWRELLPGAVVADDSDFFKLGGHSLLVMRLLAKIREQWSVRLEPSLLYAHQRLHELAAMIDRAEPVAPSEPINADPTACSAIEQLLFAAAELGDETGRLAYSEFAGLKFDGPLDASRFAAALRETLARHPVLRSNYRATNAGVLERSIRPMPELRDLCRVESPITLDAAGEPDWGALQPLLARPFHAGSDLLIGAHVFPTTGGSTLVVLALHHLLVDEWSLDLLLHSIAREYTRGARSSTADDSTMAYRRFVAQERISIDAAWVREVGQKLATTAAQLLTPIAALPAVAIEYRFAFEDQALHAIESCALRNGCNVFSVWLALFGTLIERQFARPSPWIRTPFGVRREASLQDVMGCCIDVRLLQIAKPASGGFDALVRRVWQEVLAEHDRASVPLNRVFDEARRAGAGDLRFAGDFALVYRREMGRPIEFGDTRAVPFDVPAPAAKFGLCLHIENWPDGFRLRLEAARSAFSALDLEAIAQDLQTLAVGMDGVSRITGKNHTPPQLTSRATTPSWSEDSRNGLRACVADVWSHLVRLDGPVSDEDDFYHNAGTSLLMMRMAAEVRYQTGLAVDLPRFLQRPTFGNLLGCLVQPSLDNSISIARFGSESAPLAVLALAGMGGSGLTWYRVWQHFSSQRNQPIQMLCPDMSDMQARFSFSDAATQLERTICEAISGGASLAIAGHSAGGSLALELAARLSSTGSLKHLWLVDAFSPELMFPSRLKQFLHALILAGTRPAEFERKLQRLKTKPGGDDSEAGRRVPAPTRDGQGFYEELRTWQLRPNDLPFTFIQSTQARLKLGHIRTRSMNGLAALLRGRGRSCRVSVPHDAMLIEGAKTVAQIILDDIRQMETPPLRQQVGRQQPL